MNQGLSRRAAFAAVAGLAGLVLTRPASSQVRDLNDAINKAGRQRMLSQRCAKAYLALGQGVRTDQAEKVLADSMALFDRQLVELKAFAPTAETRTTYEALDGAWGSYKTALVGSRPSRAGADPLMAAAARVLQLAHQGTVQLEAVSGRPLGKLVNIAGRQRMLSQRMAAAYLGASWNVQPQVLRGQLGEARDEFVRAHQVLRSAPETTEAIRSDLAMAGQQFEFFEAALRGLNAGAADNRAMAEVFTTSERILQVMDGVTGQYARLTAA